MYSPIQVPTRHVPVLQALASMPASEFDKLVDAWTSLSPLVSRDELVTTATASSDSLAAGQIDAPELVDALLSMSAAIQLHHWDFETVVADASQQAETDEPAALAQYLGRLLELPTVRLTANAISLRQEAPAILHASRVITDLRPVFLGRMEHPVPSGMVVVSTLRLSYVSDSGPAEIYLSLTDDQVSELAEELHWAERKVRALTDVVVSNEIGLWGMDKDIQA